MRLDDIPIVIQESTFEERTGMRYQVEERSGDISYFKYKSFAEKYARKCSGVVEEIE